jgi:type II secretory pathway pseudopilin PulG
VGACLGLPFVLLALALIVTAFFSRETQSNVLANLVWNVAPLLLLFGLPGILVTTILGWVAVSQIRRSAGKLYGMWLAVFNGLILPLLAFDAVVYLFVGLVLMFVHLRLGLSAMVMLCLIPLISIPIAGILDFLIIRSIWRAVKKSVAAPPVQKPDRFWRWFAVTVLALIAIPFLISIVGMLAAIAIPNFVKARARAQESTRHAAEILAAQNNSFNLTTNFYIGQSWFLKGDSIEITSVEQNENQMTVKGHYNLVSHDKALLALYITSTNDIGVLTDSRQESHISKGQGDFELVHTHLVPGLPHLSMYADGKPFAALYFGNEQEAAEERTASWITNETSASAETWSPAPGEKPDFQNILNSAKSLMDEGSYEEALQRYLWYFDHSRNDAGQRGVRISFALSDWIEIGRRYPKAKQALIEIRDGDAQKFSDGEGYSELFQEIAGINQYLGDGDATLALFKAIEQRDSQLAGQCFLFAEDLLVQKGEYETCRKYMGDPQTTFERIRQSWQQMKKFEEQNTARNEEQRKRIEEMAKTNSVFAHLPFFPTPPPFADKHFIEQTRQLIEILVATGGQLDAKRIQGEALVILNAPELQSAVSNAELKIQKPDSFQTLAEQPPAVVETFPASGARDVDPGEMEIRVRFSKEMSDGSWSWSTAWENSTPEFIGQPHYESDSKTCVAKVKLEPNKTYAFWLNSENFHNFKDADGRPAVPYLLIFQTKPDANAPAISAAQNWLALIDKGNYSESWTNASPIFQIAVTEPDWENSMNTFRKPLGALVSRKLKSAERLTQMTGAPDGQYVVMQFETSFTDKKSAVETVTFMLEKAGQWKSAGYFIK